MIGQQKASGMASLCNAGRLHLHPIFLALKRLQIYVFVGQCEIQKASSFAILHIAS